MAVILVTYDLKKQGQNYHGVHEYLKRFTYCKSMESVWFLDTATSTAEIRDGLKKVTDQNDVIFVGRLQRTWKSFNLGRCAEWLNDPSRTW